MLREGAYYVGFTASGHAGFTKGGQDDIVCSAISALTQSALLGLQEFLNLPLGVSISEEEGIHCVLGQACTSAQVRDADIIFNTMLLGLRAIQDAYGKTLNIIEREV